jgi:hypothetical protein
VRGLVGGGWEVEPWCPVFDVFQCPQLCELPAGISSSVVIFLAPDENGEEVELMEFEAGL